MISIGYILDRIQDVKFADYLAIFPMIAAWTIKPFFKSKYQNTWLICEEAAEARDNGYHFFKYMSENQPQQKCFYAIKKNSVDYKKVKVLGDIIEYGSIQHWLAYFLCEYNISSQKGGKPNAALCSFMELNGIFKSHNIFLQHGVIINDLRWLYADRSNIEMFISSTIPEQEFIKNQFGYSEETVQLTGLPRFDNLHDLNINKKCILIMPTWRYWFSLKSKKHKELNSSFDTSEYYYRWQELLNSIKLNDLIEQYNLEIIFYLHRNIQNSIEAFKTDNRRIKIASWKEYEIQELLKSAAMMITDYSSVFFDMIYMKKPVLFYQFDEKKYRRYQYSTGYFNYHNNPFGETFSELNSLLTGLQKMIDNDFEFSEIANSSHQQIFKYWDQHNSERIYKLLEKKKHDH